ncbi:hypothetical protein MHYP_G00297330, partial [Metynnis hypsauchen]
MLCFTWLLLPLLLLSAARQAPADLSATGQPGHALARSAEEHEDGGASHHGGGYKIVQWEWSYVQTPYIIAIWLLVASVAKI